jgi:hypothetical protein
MHSTKPRRPCQVVRIAVAPGGCIPNRVAILGLGLGDCGPYSLTATGLILPMIRSASGSRDVPFPSLPGDLPLGSLPGGRAYVARVFKPHPYPQLCSRRIARWISRPWTSFMTSIQPFQMVCHPGCPSDLRPMNPPRLAMVRQNCCGVRSCRGRLSRGLQPARPFRRRGRFRPPYSRAG